VKTLRGTGAGMMECKGALRTGGIDAAARSCTSRPCKGRQSGPSRLSTSAACSEAAFGRTGQIGETDRRAPARVPGFAAGVARAALAASATSSEAVAALKLDDGATVDDMRRQLVAKIGEKIDVRRAGMLTAPDRIGAYVHGTRIGTLVALKGGDDVLARELAMHVAAVNPQYVKPSDVPANVVAKEREILVAQAATEGKPPAIVDKMVEGRLRKYLAEICLTGQPFVKDPDTTVEKLLANAKAEVTGFLRYEVGEGIEKKQEDFAAEVMAQVQAAKDKGQPDKPS
jgi:elongation factor Ts